MASSDEGTSDFFPKIVLCVPGPWDRVADAERLQAAAACQEGVDIDLELREAEPEVPEAFALWNGHGELALGDGDLAALEGHRSVAYLVSTNYQREHAALVAHTMLRAAVALLDLGGLAVKCESSGLALSASGLRDVLERATKGLAESKTAPDEEARRDARLGFWCAMLDAYVRPDVADDEDEGVVCSCGMQLLGRPDCTMALADVAPESSPAELFTLLGLYLLAEAGERPVKDGQVFRGAHGDRYRLTRERCERYDEEDLMFNRWGFIRLWSAAPPAAVAPDVARRVQRILAFLAGADGKIDRTEEAVLASYRERFGIPADEAATLEREGATGKGITVGKTKEERELLQQAMMEVVTADGEVHDGEVRRLKKVVTALGLTVRDLTGPLRAILS